VRFKVLRTGTGTDERGQTDALYTSLIAQALRLAATFRRLGG